jgi:predicted flap endonuclease-1-like 5' DNA nuclease
MSHKQLFFVLPLAGFLVSGFAPMLAEEPSSGGGLGWIGVLIVLILLIPLVMWLMRSSGVKMTDHAYAGSDSHGPIQSSLPLESEAINLAPVNPAPVKAASVAVETKEVIENVVEQIGEAAAEGEAEIETIAPVPDKVEPDFTAAAASHPTRSATAPNKPDDLVMIEGIGPKIARILQENGITTFAELAAADLGQVKTMLAKAGLGNIADPGTWAEQAQLAADGRWDELKTLQNNLKRGRRG